MDCGCRRQDRLHRAGQSLENGYIESFNVRLRDERLDGEIFYSLRAARIVIESWRRHYNTNRPHASLGYKSLALEVFVPALATWPAALRRVAPPAMLAKQPTQNIPPGPLSAGDSACEGDMVGEDKDACGHAQLLRG
jgi:transposase InsO family protein